MELLYLEVQASVSRTRITTTITRIRMSARTYAEQK
jgi:hypothetical protein